MKCIGINLAKQVQYLYADHYKMLIQWFNEDLNKKRTIQWSWISRQHIKGVSSPNTQGKSNSYQNPCTHPYGQNYSKIYIERQKN